MRRVERTLEAGAFGTTSWLVVLLLGGACDRSETEPLDDGSAPTSAPTSTVSPENDGESDEDVEAGEDDDGWTGQDPAAELFEIELEVDYAGPSGGALLAGAFATCPPTNAPVSFRRVVDPVYPQRVTLIDVEPGDYCIYGYIDEPPENPTFPGPEDPQGSTPRFMVDADTPLVEITMFDPESAPDTDTDTD